MQQEVVLAMLAKEPAQGYQLRARLGAALGPLGEGINAGQIYVTLSRLERAGLVTRQGAGTTSPSAGDRVAWHDGEPGTDGRSHTSAPSPERMPDRPDRKVYELTATGQSRLAEWLTDVEWPKPDLAEFHLKLVAAAQAHLADPIAILDAQRRELLRRLRQAQRAAMAEPDGSDAGLLLEGIVLRLQADLRWLEECERSWTERRTRP